MIASPFPQIIPSQLTPLPQINITPVFLPADFGINFISPSIFGAIGATGIIQAASGLLGLPNTGVASSLPFVQFGSNGSILLQQNQQTTGLLGFSIRPRKSGERPPRQADNFCSGDGGYSCGAISVRQELLNSGHTRLQVFGDTKGRLVFELEVFYSENKFANFLARPKTNSDRPITESRGNFALTTDLVAEFVVPYGAGYIGLFQGSLLDTTNPPNRLGRFEQIGNFLGSFALPNTR